MVLFFSTAIIIAIIIIAIFFSIIYIAIAIIIIALQKYICMHAFDTLCLQKVGCGSVQNMENE